MQKKDGKRIMQKKYYWLKLQRDFFKRHDIRIIEDMPNGKDYILFYMKLLVESISHEGRLRFNETIPYNDSMLATITHTNIDIVRTAVKIFDELDLMSVLDDGTLYMNETEKMVGAETEWAGKKREYREKIEHDGGQKRTLSDKSKSKSLELEKEIDKELDNNLDTKSHDRNYSKEWESIKKYWNDKGLPEYRTMIMHESNSGELLNLMLPYSYAELVKAIDNYHQFLEKEEHPYQTFKGFMGKGIARFFDGAKPWARYEKEKEDTFDLNTCTDAAKNKYYKFITQNNRDPKNNRELEEFKGAEK